MSYAQIVDKDFQELKTFLNQKYPFFKYHQSIKKTHKHLYYIIIWLEEVKIKSSSPANCFLNEINNNVYFVIHGMAIESKKLIASALRTIIECQFKYIYYKDHLIEYKRLEKNEHNFGRADFNEYIKRFPDIFDSCKEFINDVVSEMGNLYLRASNVIHSSIITDFLPLSNIKDVKLSKKELTEVENLVLDTSKLFVLMFFLFFKDLIISNSINRTTYDFLLKFLDKKAKREIAGFLSR